MASNNSISGVVSNGYHSKIEFKTREQFPTRGHPRYLYIATDENKMYRWDNEYIPISGGAGSGVDINDNVISKFSTWSSEKINEQTKIDCASTEDILGLFNRG